jgi:hypothetical protein
MKVMQVSCTPQQAGGLTGGGLLEVRMLVPCCAQTMQGPLSHMFRWAPSSIHLPMITAVPQPGSIWTLVVCVLCVHCCIDRQMLAYPVAQMSLGCCRPKRVPVVGDTVGVCRGSCATWWRLLSQNPNFFLLPLPQAAQRVPVVGDIVGALWELRDLVAVASGNAANCATLAAFGADIMSTFDFQGERNHPNPVLLHRDSAPLQKADIAAELESARPHSSRCTAVLLSGTSIAYQANTITDKMCIQCALLFRRATTPPVLVSILSTLTYVSIEALVLAACSQKSWP